MKLFFSIFYLFFILANSCLAFSDISNDYIYNQEIDYIKSKNIINGYIDGTFKPEKEITRGEFLKLVITSKYGQGEIDQCIWESLSNDFFGISKEEWVAKYLCIAKRDNIVKGYEDGRFYPEQTIKYNEASKIVINTIDEDNFKQWLSEQDYQNSEWFIPYIDYLNYKKSLIPTISYTEQYITRGESAFLIANFNNFPIDPEIILDNTDLESQGYKIQRFYEFVRRGLFRYALQVFPSGDYQEISNIYNNTSKIEIAYTNQEYTKAIVVLTKQTDKIIYEIDLKIDQFFIRKLNHTKIDLTLIEGNSFQEKLSKIVENLN